MPTTGDKIYASHFNNQTYKTAVTECPYANAAGTPGQYYQTGVWYGQYGFPGRIRASAGIYLFDDDSYNITVYRMENGSWYNVLSFYVPETTSPVEYDIPIHQMTPDFYKLKIYLQVNGDGWTKGNYDERVKIFPYSGNTSSSQYNLSWLAGFAIKRTSNNYSQQLIIRNPPDVSNNYFGTTITFEQFGAYYGW